MIGRANFAADLVGSRRYGEIEDPALLAGKYNWQDPRDALDYYFDLLLSRDVPIARAAVEQYLSQSSGPLGERLRGMLHLLLTLPEFQLM
jgi:hypothetical protein